MKKQQRIVNLTVSPAFARHAQSLGRDKRKLMRAIMREVEKHVERVDWTAYRIDKPFLLPIAFEEKPTKRNTCPVSDYCALFVRDPLRDEIWIAMRGEEAAMLAGVKHGIKVTGGKYFVISEAELGQAS